MAAKAVLFDAYGTLFNVHSVVETAGSGLPREFSLLWRRKQLEHTWLRALMDRYEDFWSVTEASLRAAADEMGLLLSAEQRGRLMQAYLQPSAFPDARPMLDRLSGMPLAILSNGSPQMLEAMVRHNAMDSYFTEIISVDRVKTYKPSPRVYALGTELLKLPAGQILFVSSNAWDAAGAKAFGYRVSWCNRSGGPMDCLGFEPDFVVSGLDQFNM